MVGATTYCEVAGNVDVPWLPERDAVPGPGSASKRYSRTRLLSASRKRGRMTLEALNTTFAGATFAVIGATAIAAIVQLRHLRASNQMTALLTILQDWQKPEMQAWVQFVRKELPERLKDPAYVDSIEAVGLEDRTEHAWLNLCDYYEQLGAYVKYGLIDRRSLLDVGCSNFLSVYRILRPLIERTRAIRGSTAVFENFEYLAVLAFDWTKLHSQGAYPAGASRFSDLEA